MGACTLGRESVVKEKRFLHTRKTPHKQGQGKGASEPQREAQRDRRAKGKTEKLHFGSYVAHTLVASRGWVWRLRPRDWSSVRGMGVDYHEGTLRGLIWHSGRGLGKTLGPPACVSRSVVSNSVTPWNAAHQAPLSMGFSRLEYWSGLPVPSPGVLEPGSPALQTNSLPSEPPGKPWNV